MTETTHGRPDAHADAGILGFGHAASAVERTTVVRTLQGYLSAEARADGARACSYLAPATQAQVAGPGGECSASLHRALANRARLISRMRRTDRVSAVRIDVRALRVEGTRAFVVFTQPGTPQAFFPLFRFDGRWKLGATELTLLP